MVAIGLILLFSVDFVRYKTRKYLREGVDHSSLEYISFIKQVQHVLYGVVDKHTVVSCIDYDECIRTYCTQYNM